MTPSTQNIQGFQLMQTIYNISGWIRPDSAVRFIQQNIEADNSGRVILQISKLQGGSSDVSSRVSLTIKESVEDFQQIEGPERSLEDYNLSQLTGSRPSVLGQIYGEREAAFVWSLAIVRGVLYNSVVTRCICSKCHWSMRWFQER
ncbi:MAG: hypothetical protein R2827_14365 [Bdellovibrionales bacterium]